MIKEKSTYCSLDIETSGFDPLNNEILEVGFVFFELTNTGVKITEEWTSVFKPTKPVEQKILALTGIRLEELEKAPSFSEHRDFLQEKLGSAIIVGHNIGFDVKFLEGMGLKFSGKTIDTLELVQWILPTHHSYNLENLMHTFGVDHSEAHRALADSKASLTVLEKLLRTYQSFPKALKQRVVELASSRFLWADFLEVTLPAIKTSVAQKPSALVAQCSPAVLSSGSVLAYPLGSNSAVEALYNLQKLRTKSLLVVPSQATVFTFWKQGVVKPIFADNTAFDGKKFEQFLQKPELTNDEVRFGLKILVWQHTNWQCESIFDLNLSFFGGQFRSFVTKLSEDQSREKLLCCDMQTFCALRSHPAYFGRTVVVSGLVEFETCVSAGISEKASSGHIGYLLRSYYSPEAEAGNATYKDGVLEALEKTDLFFGLTGALLSSGSAAYQTIKLTDELHNSSQFQKLTAAAKNYVTYLEEANKTFRSNEIERFGRNLLNFFELSENRIRWVEISEKRATYFSSPIQIHDLVTKTLAPYKKLCFVDALGTDLIYDYILKRTGLTHLERNSVQWQQKPLKNMLPISFEAADASANVECICMPNVPSENEVLDLLSPEHLPAAVLFGSGLQVKGFYDQYYEKLRASAFLAVQSGTGGLGKLLRNFNIRPNSVLVATDKFLLKTISGDAHGEPMERLGVKTLVLCHLPFEVFTHPYQEAVSQLFENPFQEYSLPRAVYNLHRVLRFFMGSDLHKVMICDPKLAKPYAKAFLDYLAAMQQLRVVNKTKESVSS